MARERTTAEARAEAPLTPSERVFVDEYLIDLNGTRAYRAAYPDSNYTTARSGASKVLAKPNVRAEVAAARRAQQRRTRLSADEVLREVARIAFSDALDLFDDEGQLRPVRQIPLETRRALASVKVGRERTTRRVTRAGKSKTTTTVRTSVLEYRFANKLDALGRLCDFLGLRESIPPIEVLLSVLPPAMADEVRRVLVDAPAQAG